MNLFRHAGLKAKLIIPLVLTTISVGLISADQFGRSLKTAVFEEFSSKGVALAKSLASSAQDTILARDASTVQGFIDEYKGIRGVGFVYVLNNKGEVLAHTFTPAFPDNFNISVPHGKVSATISKQELIWQNRHFLDVEAPILAGTLGYAHVGMDIDIAQQMTADAIRRALLTSLLISALGLLFLYYILNLTIKQIVYLSSVSKKISEGAKLDLLSGHQPIDLAGTDEISILANNFSKMVSELEGQRENLEALVEERTQKLQKSNLKLESEVAERRRTEDALMTESMFVGLLQKSAIAANEAETVAEAIESNLRIVSETLGYCFGSAFFCSEDDETSMVSANIWYIAKTPNGEQFKNASQGLSFALGSGLPGRVLATAQTCIIANVARDANFRRKSVATNIGIKGAIAVPIFVNKKVVAALEFFSEREIIDGKQLKDVLDNIGIQIGRVIDRAQAQDQLELQRAKLITSAKMSSLGEMAGGIAHEINNPLAIIKNISSQMEELLAEEPFDKSLVAERASKLQKTTDRIAKIVQGLRTFSRDGGNDRFEAVNIQQLIEETLSFCKERFQKHGTALTIEAFPVDLVLEGRATQLSQVILNLLNNADDAISNMKEKWIKLSVIDKKDSFEIRIADCGKGITPEVQKKLFQPFFTTKEIGKGTGMGLSISLGIVKSHGGSITIDSKCPNTCFVVELPKAQAPRTSLAA